jgi:hypothetical protein
MIDGRSPTTTRRRLLRAGGSLVLASLAPGAAGVARAAADGVVWSRTGRHPGTQRLYDVVHGPEGFLVCGYGRHDGETRGVVAVADERGRIRGRRRGPEWGSRAHDVVATDGTYLLAGRDGDAPTLVGFDPPFDRQWRATYRGTVAGTAHASTRGEGHAVAWNDRREPVGPVVVGTDDEGAERWRDRPGDGRLTDLLAPDARSLVGVGVGDEDGGWATVWNPDGSRERDLSLSAPGEGPLAAAADGGGVVLAGTTGEGWWLERRTPEWDVAWTRRYAGGGEGRGVDDVVVRADGYGVLGHDGGETVLLRTDGSGAEEWRGRYASSGGSGGRDRGLGMVPVDGDEFVLAGADGSGAEGADWWTARVGRPGATTPAATTTPPPTDATSTTTPPPTDATFTTTPPPTDAASTVPPTDGTTADTDGTTSSLLPGFGVLAALGGLAGWVAAWSDDD